MSVSIPSKISSPFPYLKAEQMSNIVGAQGVGLFTEIRKRGEEGFLAAARNDRFRDVLNIFLSLNPHGF